MHTFEDNMNLVYFIVNKKYKHKRNKEDLYQQGFVGLQKAINSYDDKRIVKFSTYAMVCILNEIKYFLRRENKEKSLNFSDIDDLNTDKEVEIDLSKLQLKLSLKNLNNEEQYIIKHLLLDATQNQIAKNLKISQSFLAKKIRAIRQKIRGDFK